MKKRLFIGLIVLALLILAALGAFIGTGDWCSPRRSPSRSPSCRSCRSSRRSRGWPAAP